jgi:hypothetical protein
LEAGDLALGSRLRAALPAAPIGWARVQNLTNITGCCSSAKIWPSLTDNFE